MRLLVACLTQANALEPVAVDARLYDTVARTKGTLRAAHPAGLGGLLATPDGYDLYSDGRRLDDADRLVELGVAHDGETLLLAVPRSGDGLEAPGTPDPAAPRPCHLRRLGPTFWPPELVRALAAAQAGFAAGLAPRLAGEGEGATYFVLGPKAASEVDDDEEDGGGGGAPPGAAVAGEYVACFKPRDEEQYAPLNPRDRRAPFGTQGSRVGVPSGDAYAREVAAYLLDHGGVAGVPPTGLVESWHPAYCNRIGAQGAGDDGDAQSPASAGGGTASPPPPLHKVGSFQLFVADASKIDSARVRDALPDAEVQKIALLDIRLLNLDRNDDNLLLRWEMREPPASSAPPQQPGAKPKPRWASRRVLTPTLTPIDHGFVIPADLGVADCDWVWLDWPQVRRPVVPELAAYVARLDVEADIARLKAALGPALAPACYNTLRITYGLLQRGVAAGMCLGDIARVLCRTGDLTEKSVVERFVDTAILSASAALHNDRLLLSATSSSSSAAGAGLTPSGAAPASAGRAALSASSSARFGSGAKPPGAKPASYAAALTSGASASAAATDKPAPSTSEGATSGGGTSSDPAAAAASAPITPVPRRPTSASLSSAVPLGDGQHAASTDAPTDGLVTRTSGTGTVVATTAAAAAPDVAAAAGAAPGSLHAEVVEDAVGAIVAATPRQPQHQLRHSTFTGGLLHRPSLSGGSPPLPASPEGPSYGALANIAALAAARAASAVQGRQRARIRVKTLSQVAPLVGVNAHAALLARTGVQVAVALALSSDATLLSEHTAGGDGGRGDGAAQVAPAASSIVLPPVPPLMRQGTSAGFTVVTAGSSINSSLDGGDASSLVAGVALAAARATDAEAHAAAHHRSHSAGGSAAPAGGWAAYFGIAEADPHAVTAIGVGAVWQGRLVVASATPRGRDVVLLEDGEVAAGMQATLAVLLATVAQAVAAAPSLPAAPSPPAHVPPTDGSRAGTPPSLLPASIPSPSRVTTWGRSWSASGPLHALPGGGCGGATTADLPPLTTAALSPAAALLGRLFDATTTSAAPSQADASSASLLSSASEKHLSLASLPTSGASAASAGSARAYDATSDGASAGRAGTDGGASFAIIVAGSGRTATSAASVARQPALSIKSAFTVGGSSPDAANAAGVTPPSTLAGGGLAAAQRSTTFHGVPSGSGSSFAAAVRGADGSASASSSGSGESSGGGLRLPHLHTPQRAYTEAGVPATAPAPPYFLSPSRRTGGAVIIASPYLRRSASFRFLPSEMDGIDGEGDDESTPAGVGADGTRHGGVGSLHGSASMGSRLHEAAASAAAGHRHGLRIPHPTQVHAASATDGGSLDAPADATPPREGGGGASGSATAAAIGVLRISALQRTLRKQSSYLTSIAEAAVEDASGGGTTGGGPAAPLMTRPRTHSASVAAPVAAAAAAPGTAASTSVSSASSAGVHSVIVHHLQHHHQPSPLAHSSPRAASSGTLSDAQQPHSEPPPRHPQQQQQHHASLADPPVPLVITVAGPCDVSAPMPLLPDAGASPVLLLPPSAAAASSTSAIEPSALAQRVGTQAGAEALRAAAADAATAAAAAQPAGGSLASSRGPSRSFASAAGGSMPRPVSSFNFQAVGGSGLFTSPSYDDFSSAASTSAPDSAVGGASSSHTPPADNTPRTARVTTAASVIVAYVHAQRRPVVAVEQVALPAPASSQGAAGPHALFAASAAGGALSSSAAVSLSSTGGLLSSRARGWSSFLAPPGSTATYGGSGASSRNNSGLGLSSLVPIGQSGSSGGLAGAGGAGGGGGTGGGAPPALSRTSSLSGGDSGANASLSALPTFAPVGFGWDTGSAPASPAQGEATATSGTGAAAPLLPGLSRVPALVGVPTPPAVVVDSQPSPAAFGATLTPAGKSGALGTRAGGASAAVATAVPAIASPQRPLEPLDDDATGTAGGDATGAGSGPLRPGSHHHLHHLQRRMVFETVHEAPPSHETGGSSSSAASDSGGDSRTGSELSTAYRPPSVSTSASAHVHFDRSALLQTPTQLPSPARAHLLPRAGGLGAGIGGGLSRVGRLDDGVSPPVDTAAAAPAVVPPLAQVASFFPPPVSATTTGASGAPIDAVADTGGGMAPLAECGGTASTAPTTARSSNGGGDASDVVTTLLVARGEPTGAVGAGALSPLFVSPTLGGGIDAFTVPSGAPAATAAAAAVTSTESAPLEQPPLPIPSPADSTLGGGPTSVASAPTPRGPAAVAAPAGAVSTAGGGTKPAGAPQRGGPGGGFIRTHSYSADIFALHARDVRKGARLGAVPDTRGTGVTTGGPAGGASTGHGLGGGSGHLQFSYASVAARGVPAQAVAAPAAATGNSTGSPTPSPPALSPASDGKPHLLAPKQQPPPPLLRRHASMVEVGTSISSVGVGGGSSSRGGGGGGGPTAEERQQLQGTPYGSDEGSSSGARGGGSSGPSSSTQPPFSGGLSSDPEPFTASAFTPGQPGGGGGGGLGGGGGASGAPSLSLAAQFERAFLYFVLSSIDQAVDDWRRAQQQREAAVAGDAGGDGNAGAAPPSAAAPT